MWQARRAQRGLDNSVRRKKMRKPKTETGCQKGRSTKGRYARDTVGREALGQAHGIGRATRLEDVDTPAVAVLGVAA